MKALAALAVAAVRPAHLARSEAGRGIVYREPRLYRVGN